MREQQRRISRRERYGLPNHEVEQRRPVLESVLAVATQAGIVYNGWGFFDKLDQASIGSFSLAVLAASITAGQVIRKLPIEDSKVKPFSAAVAGSGTFVGSTIAEYLATHEVPTSYWSLVAGMAAATIAYFVTKPQRTRNLDEIYETLRERKIPTKAEELTIFHETMQLLNEQRRKQKEMGMENWLQELLDQDPQLFYEWLRHPQLSDYPTTHERVAYALDRSEHGKRLSLVQQYLPDIFIPDYCQGRPGPWWRHCANKYSQDPPAKRP